jgi:hypothetical protein
MQQFRRNLAGLYVPWSELPVLLDLNQAQLLDAVRTGLLDPGPSSPDIYGVSVHFSSLTDFLLRRCLRLMGSAATPVEDIMESLFFSGESLVARCGEDALDADYVLAALEAGDDPMVEALEMSDLDFSIQQARALREQFWRAYAFLVDRIEKDERGDIIRLTQVGPNDCGRCEDVRPSNQRTRTLH